MDDEKKEQNEKNDGAKETAETAFSVDFKLLLEFKKQDSASETETLSAFFIQKYQDLCQLYCNKFLKLIDLDNSMKDPEKAHFFSRLQEHYLPQALKSFNPEIITNRETYIFATYMDFYLRHAVRDLTREVKKARSKALSDSYITSSGEEPSAEDKIISEMEAEQKRKAELLVKEQLSPLQLEIFDLLKQGKKQKEITITNPKTGKKYTKGYISKEVSVIRYWTKKFFDEFV